MDGSSTVFTSLSKVFQSYRAHEMVKMKGCMQRSPGKFAVEKNSALSGIQVQNLINRLASSLNAFPISLPNMATLDGFLFYAQSQSEHPISF